MILSFHPLYIGDQNITCAGRQPGADDLAAIRAADAVALPQGCYRSLYEMAQANCAQVFPQYDARFEYPGKIGQIEMFRKYGIAHPASEIYHNLAEYEHRQGQRSASDGIGFPLVFKLDWGGEGETVWLVKSDEELDDILKKTDGYEKSGQSGFLLQEYIPCGNRTLRVAVIGRRLLSYWRVGEPQNGFYSNLGRGAAIERDSGPDLQEKAVALVGQICHKTGINLAGFDVIFSRAVEDPAPLLLEVNYFFGRKGLGGSEAYYEILLAEIEAWIQSLRD